MEDTFLKKFFIFMGIELIVAIGIIGYFVKIGSSRTIAEYNPVGKPNTSQSKVLGIETEVSPTPASHIIYKVVTPTPTDVPKKIDFRIAIIGDSFEDTMGETGEYLQKALHTKYPDTNFLIFNYGKGATTVKEGLTDFDYNFQYGIRNYPSVTDLKPDIIIIGSYANNPPDPFDRDWHWITMTQLVQRAQKVTPNVYMLAEVAPLRANYGDGPNGVNWDQKTSVQHSGEVIKLMENVLSLSKALHVPLIDVYSQTVKDGPNGKEGDPKDISVSDGIHPSQDGHELIANKIAEVVKLN
jgi:hypothetical protein